jgi:hypothetical protein
MTTMSISSVISESDSYYAMRLFLGSGVLQAVPKAVPDLPKVPVAIELAKRMKRES